MEVGVQKLRELALRVSLGGNSIGFFGRLNHGLNHGLNHFLVLENDLGHYLGGQKTN